MKNIYYGYSPSLVELDIALSSINTIQFSIYIAVLRLESSLEFFTRLAISLG